MALLNKVFIKKPKSSNFDLSRISQFTMMPGAIYPALIEEILPGDKVRLRIDSKIMTYPLKAPLLSTFKLQADVFFVPTRLYNRQLRNNTPDFDPASIYFPYFTMPTPLEQDVTISGLGAESGRPVSDNEQPVKKSSLLDFLGIPYGFRDYSAEVTDIGDQLKFNAIPALGYYSICLNYYASAQYGGIPVINTAFVDNPDISTIINQSDMLKFDTWDSVIDGLDSGNVNVTTLVPRGVDFVLYSRLYNAGGLCVKAYQPDVNNRWLSKATYDDMVTRASISTEGGSITINQIRTANKFVKYLERLLVGRGGYGDFVLTEYGVKTDQNLDIPEFLGSSSTEVFFTEVVSNSNSPAVDADTNGLGDLAGKGNGRMNGQTHYFRASEHGYLMVLVSLTPRVSYYQGVRPYLLKTNMQDVFAPALDNLGFQPVMTSQLNAFGQLRQRVDGETVYSNSVPVWSAGSPFESAVGYQPAWTEYMTAVNELHGELVDTLRYWTLARTFAQPSTAEAVGDNVSVDYRPFVQPDMFNYAFENVDTLAENFIAQFAFDLFMRRPISKQIMPTL